jgi:hypothetical protein
LDNYPASYDALLFGKNKILHIMTINMMTGITINVIDPSALDTSMMTSLINKAKKSPN